LYNRLLVIRVTFVLVESHATAWLSAPDCKKPSVFDTDTGVRMPEMIGHFFTIRSYLFLKNDMRIRSESCFGWNQTSRIRKLSKTVSL